MYWVVRYTANVINWQHVRRYDRPYGSSVATRREATRYAKLDDARKRARWMNLVGWEVRVVRVVTRKKAAA